MKKRLLLLITVISLLRGDLQALSVGELVTREPRRLRVQRGWVPGVRVLDLSNMNIDSLKGLEDIQGIESVTRLYLNDNNIQTIESGDFAAAVNLTALSISGNNLEIIEPNAFAGLKNLKVLNLSNNSIESIPQEGLNGMPGLRFLGMSSNPMINPKGLQSQVPTAFITTLPINQKNLTKWGAWLGAGIVTLVAAVAGIAEVSKRQKQTRLEKEEALPPEQTYKEQLRPLQLSEERERFLQELTPETIKGSPEIVHQISTDEIAFLNAPQLQAINLEQLTKDQIESLLPDQIAVLTKNQAGTLVNMGVLGGRYRQLEFSIDQINALFALLPEPEFTQKISTLRIKQLEEGLRSPRPKPRTKPQKKEEGKPEVSDDVDATMVRAKTTKGYVPPFRGIIEETDEQMKGLSGMTHKQLEDLGDNISNYPAHLIPRLQEQIAFIDGSQLEYLTANQVAHLSRYQVNALSNYKKLQFINISLLSDDAIQGIPSTKIPTLSQKEKAALIQKWDLLTDAQKAVLLNNNHNSL
jgi:Leucine-rich repeat (LRR) protein